MSNKYLLFTSEFLLIQLFLSYLNFFLFAFKLKVCWNRWRISFRNDWEPFRHFPSNKENVPYQSNVRSFPEHTKNYSNCIFIPISKKFILHKASNKRNQQTKNYSRCHNAILTNNFRHFYEISGYKTFFYFIWRKPYVIKILNDFFCNTRNKFQKPNWQKKTNKKLFFLLMIIHVDGKPVIASQHNIM